jgi:hypothetical protein
VQSEKLHLPAAFVLAILTINIPSFAAPREFVLHVFGRGKDGGHPVAGLVSDRSGSLYGTTIGGGTYGWGTVFELVRGANGQWTEKVLYSFQGGNDGSAPYAALVIDRFGNLYGTTDVGGGGSNCGQRGCGTVFELIHDANGKWEKEILHRFNRADGDTPQADLAIDKAGVLYGTTYFGGEGNTCFDPGSGDTSCGVVFEVMSNGRGKWIEKVLHSFNYNNGRDGSNPFLNSLAFDANGNLYGTTGVGGTGQCYDYNGDLIGCGTIFELRKSSDGHWVEKILHNFQGMDGVHPSGLIWDSKGFLYGTTVVGGNLNYCDSGCGNIFKLTPNGHHGWREEVLFTFGGQNGNGPGQLTIDRNGNLYGATASGGANSTCNYGIGCGTVFALLAEENGRWALRTLHSFDGDDGSGPNGGLVLDSGGGLYGTAFEGGKVTECRDQSGCGLVFKIVR